MKTDYINNLIKNKPDPDSDSHFLIYGSDFSGSEFADLYEYGPDPIFFAIPNHYGIACERCWLDGGAGLMVVLLRI
ncbi:hypothetical protein WN943_001041 [Citrus x changshan-huyou]